MKKVVLIVGLANGGKSTTLYRYVDRKRLSKRFTKKVNGHRFHFFDKSNCDVCLACWVHSIKSIEKLSIDNLIGTFCLDNEQMQKCYLKELDYTFVIKTLQELEADIYFYILTSGKNGKINRDKVKTLEDSFGKDRVAYDESSTIDGDCSKDFKIYMEKITKL